MNVSFLSVVASMMLALLAGLVALKEPQRGRVSLAVGLLLMAVVELCDSLVARHVVGYLDVMRVVLFAKSVIPAMFLLYGMALGGRGGVGGRLLAAGPLLGIAAIFAGVALLSPIGQLYAGLDPVSGRFLALGGVGYWFYTGLMVFCIAALVNLESVFAGVRAADRWRVKFEFLGVGAILAGMIFYFSQGLLYRAVNLNLLPARSGVMAAAALLIGYSRLYRGRSANLVVSRQALYRSFTLIAVGLYLLVLGLLGAGMRRLRVPVTSELTAFVAVLSGAAFLALLLSEEIRRRVKVFLTKHFYAQKHDYRQAWLDFSNALAGCRRLAEVQTAIVDRYRELFGLRYALLYARDRGSASFALATPPDSGGMPGAMVPSPGLVGYFAETGRVMNPVDGEYTPTPEEARFIRETGAWLVVPLMAAEHVEAFVVFGRQVAPEPLTYEDFDLMKIVGRQAVLSLKNFELAEELTEAREMAVVAKVSSFVIHDLKNLAYTFSLMMENVGEHIGEPEFQRDLVHSIRNTVAKMNALIAKLKAFPGKMELALETVDVAAIGREALEEVHRLRAGVEFAADLGRAETRADGQELRKVALNLLLNACDAVGPSGTVRITTGTESAGVFLRVADNGVGMSQEYVQDHLFKPFRTTKEKGLGIGLYQCRQIVEAHGGRIDVATREGEGTAFTVLLPAAPVQPLSA